MTDEHLKRCECARIAVEFSTRRIPSEIDTEGAMKTFANYVSDNIQMRCLEISARECKDAGIRDPDLVIARALELEAFVRYEKPVAAVSHKKRGRQKKAR